MGVCRTAQPHVRDGVPGDAVGTGLQDNELGAAVADELLRAAPGGKEIRVGDRGRGQRQVEFATSRLAQAGFITETRARVEVAAVFVYVPDPHGRIFFLGIKDTIAVVRIDIHVSDTLDAIVLAQYLDQDTNVIDGTEAGG